MADVKSDAKTAPMRMVVVREKLVGSTRVFDATTPEGLKKAHAWIEEMKSLLPGFLDDVRPVLVVESPSLKLYAGMFTHSDDWATIHKAHGPA